MGQQGSTASGLQKLCCNNNLCNFDSNVENITEINKRSGGVPGAMEDSHFMMRGNNGSLNGSQRMLD